MEQPSIRTQVDQVVARHDLLQHPFYRAWTAGQLRAEDLRRYAQEYYHQVAAFPTYLSALHSRLPDGELRRSVLRNLCEEEIMSATHSDLWLDFAEGMGAKRDDVRASVPSPATRELIAAFRRIAAEASPVAALGAFYAYESQVARIAGLKAEGLREFYGADVKTCAYFVQHSEQDVHHARVWANQIDELLSKEPAPDLFSTVTELLSTVEDAATALWKSLDGIHAGSCAGETVTH